MPVAHLHALLIDALIARLPGWKFVARERHFKRQAAAGTLWYMHLAFVNHTDDFDVVVDVAVEFVRDKATVCVVGAQLGNIAGVGQTRVEVRTPGDVAAAIDRILNEFQTVGVPFLERFSRPDEVLSVLRQGGREAALISPIGARHQGQIRALEHMIGRGSSRDEVPKR
jgi:hypothetical protein